MSAKFVLDDDTDKLFAGLDDDIHEELGTESDLRREAGKVEDENTDDKIPVEDLIPPCIRFGRHHGDNTTISGPVDPAIYGYDIDLMKERPWNNPGADKTDYFNYDFDEKSWRAYCYLQANGIYSLREKAQQFLATLEKEAIATVQQNSLPMPGSYLANMSGGGASSGYGVSTMHNMGGQQGSYQVLSQHDHPRYKTRLCQLHIQGNCDKGDRCNFAHGQEDLRGPQEPVHSPSIMPMPVSVGGYTHHQHNTMTHGPIQETLPHPHIQVGEPSDGLLAPPVGLPGLISSLSVPPPAPGVVGYSVLPLPAHQPPFPNGGVGHAGFKAIQAGVIVAPSQGGGFRMKVPKRDRSPE
eukprot:Tbor_TRINITY_DN5393_c1_g1::TRINITY_DN5393_c1_g1_i1::g.4776::m.4776